MRTATERVSAGGSQTSANPSWDGAGTVTGGEGPGPARGADLGTGLFVNDDMHAVPCADSADRADASQHGGTPVGRADAARADADAVGPAGRSAAGVCTAGVCTAVVRRPVSYTPRRGSGLSGYERVLVRAGLGPVVGIDEAGRGACAGPLVVAAVALERWSGDAQTSLADSKVLTAPAREAAYAEITKSALAWHVVVISSREIDRLGLHVCNVAGMRRALAGLDMCPGYVLTDGFPVPGLAVPSLAMWKGDQVAACVAAASIVAKVTRDRIMRALHSQYPQYGFARHKGYSTPAHMAALAANGPCAEHRRSFVNVSCLDRCAFEPELQAGLRTAADGAEPGVTGSDDVAPEYRTMTAHRIETSVVGARTLDLRPDGPIVESIAVSSAAAGLAVGAADHMPGGSSEGKP